MTFLTEEEIRKRFQKVFKEHEMKEVEKPSVISPPEEETVPTLSISASEFNWEEKVARAKRQGLPEPPKPK